MDGYFTAYEDLRVHSLMLKDAPRVEAYRQAFAQLQRDGLLEGRTVLDVGAGTGVLSILAAQHGARHVYAVEASQVAHLAEALVAHNKQQGVVTVLNARMEDVELPEPVDFIVSEWMGFYLLHENMLPSVLVARDRWLKPGGMLLPHRACLFAAPVCMDTYYADRVGVWDHPHYGIDFAPFQQAVQDSLPLQPEISTIVEPAQLLAEPQELFAVDCMTATPDSLHSFHTVRVYNPHTAGTLHGFASWFTCEFYGGVTLPTDPWSAPTHWKQTVFLLPGAFPVDPSDHICCTITLQTDPDNPRTYQVGLELSDGAEVEADQ